DQLPRRPAPAARRLAARRHDQSERWLAAPQRRALQRENHRHRVLRSVSRAGPLGMVRGPHAGRRSGVSTRAPGDELALPPRARRLEVGPETVPYVVASSKTGWLTNGPRKRRTL